MFLVMGISQKEKQLDYSQMAVCPNCGRLSQVEVFMTYSYFMLFFIPLIKWGKKYYALMKCCGITAELTADVGERIAKGQAVTIDDSTFLSVYSVGRKTCTSCGFTTMEAYDFCPKCGHRL